MPTQTTSSRASRRIASAAAPSPDASGPLQEGLEASAGVLRADGALVPRLRGKLLRPKLAFAALPASLRAAPPEPFWHGAVAVQMVHEASILHDDILDGADTRRGRATARADAGLAAALVSGDRILTSSYRAAARVGSERFLRTFIDAVDRTVEGEAEQGRSVGRVLAPGEYQAILEGKSGSLFGLALALASCVDEEGECADLEARYALGLRVGALYQMVDDVLDYCPAARRGKPAWTDFRQRKWTLPLADLGGAPFEGSQEEVRRALTVRDGGASPLGRAVGRLERDAGVLCVELREALPGASAAVEEISSWVARAREGVEAVEVAARCRSGSGTRARSSGEGTAFEEARAVGGLAVTGGWAPAAPDAASLATVDAMAVGAGDPGDWERIFSENSRSFRFASLLLPEALRKEVTGVYVFCRFTDDLVDETDGFHPAQRERLLTAWRARVEEAYWSGPVGVPLLDRVVGPAAAAGIPFGYLDGLLQGVSMDLRPVEYADLDALRRYSYGVASVVGGWVTELLGVSDPCVLDRAFSLGHAMQLTNILRDVGEDLRAGRLYLPLDRMDAHGVRRADLESAARGAAPPPDGFEALMRELMEEAEADYARAFGGIPSLPPSARLPIAVAARVYRGIHREIRRNDYDTLTKRAYTGLPRKLWLALEGAAALAVRAIPGRGASIRGDTHEPKRVLP